MTMIAEKHLSRDRIEFHKSITKNEINSIISSKDVRVLQVSAPVELNSWVLINDLLLSERPDIEIRVYGHYSQNCDLSFIRNITNVKNLSIDCLPQASNIEMLGHLEKLDTLSVGIYSLEDFKFLDSLPDSLTKLSLQATKSKKPNLIGLNRFSNLKELYLEEQQKGIEVIGGLKSLQKLTLGTYLHIAHCLTTRFITAFSLRSVSALDSKRLIPIATAE